MVRNMTYPRCTVETRLCHDPECPAQAPAQFNKKPPQPVQDRMDLCSSFLADRGCLTLRPAAEPKQSAA
jgi:hypothetical protein